MNPKSVYFGSEDSQLPKAPNELSKVSGKLQFVFAANYSLENWKQPKARSIRALVAATFMLAAGNISTVQATETRTTLPGTLAVDPLVAWNEIYAGMVATHPPGSYRGGAMLNLAIFDAVNAIEDKYQGYATKPSDSTIASRRAAAAAAGRSVLLHLTEHPKPGGGLPLEVVSTISAKYDALINSLPDNANTVAGIIIGDQAAKNIIESRINDGSVPPGPPSLQPLKAGIWRAVAPTKPVLGWWPRVRPFFLSSVEQLEVPVPPSLASQTYVDSVNEIIAVGGVNSSQRTADQSESVTFWALDPYGWGRIATAEVAHSDRDLVERARIIALALGSAADAAIIAMDSKYRYQLWRPIQAIHEAVEGTLLDDGNPNTSPVPDWKSLIPAPPFPEYLCAHCINSNSVASVLSREFDDNHAFTHTDLVSGMSRSFESFSAAGTEVSLSRIYGGIHFRFSTEISNDLAEKLAEFSTSTYLKKK